VFSGPTRVRVTTTPTTVHDTTPAPTSVLTGPGRVTAATAGTPTTAHGHGAVHDTTPPTRTSRAAPARVYAATTPGRVHA
jgi:hypothetical protein